MEQFFKNFEEFGKDSITNLTQAVFFEKVDKKYKDLDFQRKQVFDQYWSKVCGVIFEISR